jgi:hypothetical protein
MSINMGQYSAVCGIRVPHVLVNVDAKTSTLGSCQDQLVRQVARQKIPGHDVRGTGVPERAQIAS